MAILQTFLTPITPKHQDQNSKNFSWLTKRILCLQIINLYRKATLSFGEGKEHYLGEPDRDYLGITALHYHRMNVRGRPWIDLQHCRPCCRFRLAPR